MPPDSELAIKLCFGCFNFEEQINSLKFGCIEGFYDRKLFVKHVHFFVTKFLVFHILLLRVS